jgi:Cu+-exporting ATPase
MKNKLELSVQGMTCDGCVRSIERVVGRIPGVSNVDVELAENLAIVTGAFDANAVMEAIRKAGYTSQPK